MNNLINKDWWLAAIDRCIRTMAQTMMATIGTTAVLNQVDWKTVISATILAGLLSILTSIGGLPEVKEVKVDKKEEIKPAILNKDYEEVEETKKETNDSKRGYEFIVTFYSLIKDKAVENGYNVNTAVAMTAQAFTESYKKTGLSLLASKYHNYFGMKAGNKYTGSTVNLKTNEEYDGVTTSIRDNFRTYKTIEEGIDGYFEFLKYKRYANLKQCETAERYAELLKEDGWATSSVYVKTIKDNIKYVKDILEV